MYSSPASDDDDGKDEGTALPSVPSSIISLSSSAEFRWSIIARPRARKRLARSQARCLCIVRDLHV